MTAVQRYAPSVLSFLVLVLAGVQAAVAVGLSPVAVGQLVVLALTTATTWLVPLVGGRWRGKVKTGLELVGVAVTLALPFVATGTITWADGLLVAVAFIKALGAELGVQMRVDTQSEPSPMTVNVIPQQRLSEQEIATVAASSVSPVSRGRVDFLLASDDDDDEPKHRAD